MNKKFLTKNEFRFDTNPEHMGKDKEPHPTFISGRRGHKYLGNSITHSRYTNDGKPTYYFGENPNKKRDPNDRRISRVSVPFWQSEKMFSKEKLCNYRYSNRTRKKIKKFNKKYK